MKNLNLMILVTVFAITTGCVSSDGGGEVTPTTNQELINQINDQISNLNTSSSSTTTTSTTAVETVTARYNWKSDEVVHRDKIRNSLVCDANGAYLPDGTIVVLWCLDNGDVFSKVFDPKTATWSAGTKVTTVQSTDNLKAIAHTTVISSELGGVLYAYDYAGDLYVTFYNPTTAIWSTPELLETDETNLVRYVDVAMNRSGDAVVVWSQGGLRSRIYDSGSGTWQPEKLLSTIAEHGKSVIDDFGTATVVYANGANLMASTFNPLSDWDDGKIVSPNGAVLLFTKFKIPGVELDANGVPAAYWVAADQTNYVLRSASYDKVNGVWNAEKTIYTATGEIEKIDMAMSKNGTAAITWQDTDNNKYVSVNDNGVDGTWGAPHEISNLALSRDIFIEMDDDGNAVVTWLNFSNIGTVAYNAAKKTWVHNTSPGRSDEIAFVMNKASGKGVIFKINNAIEGYYPNTQYYQVISISRYE